MIITINLTRCPNLTIFYLPFTLKEQLKAVQDLLKVPFLKQDEKKELERIENQLAFRTTLDQNEKEFLKTIISKLFMIL